MSQPTEGDLIAKKQTTVELVWEDGEWVVIVTTISNYYFADKDSAVDKVNKILDSAPD